MQMEPDIDIIADGLGFPEGPVVLDNCSILVCDIHGGVIRRVAGGTCEIYADVGGGPNGLALGEGGAVFVANNGGNMRWHREGDRLISDGFNPEHFDTRIERIDPVSGSVTRILDRVDGHTLQAIDDLVPDGSDGFWFTDLGRGGPRGRTYGGVYWCKADGSGAREVAYPLPTGANGIGLSPDGRTLYATEYGAGRLWSWRIESPGRLARNGEGHGGTLLWQAPDAQLLDSLAVSPQGEIVIATQHSGVFSVISPDGGLLATLKMPEHFPTNLCFDPRDPSVVYATLSTTGRLGRFIWPTF